jgi:aryl-alcohol dehydrogenase-like predicted oxidoreductase
VIPKAPFGRTGHQSSRVIFGAAALAEAPQELADQTLELLLRHGVNHIDVASSYGDAELRIKPWMQQHRDAFFLATKADDRSARGAREELHRSLDRMGVDRVDLWQLHALADPIEWDIALSPGGALEAGLAAREEGLVDYLGVTGHGLQIAATHRRSLERFDFDSVLLPYNYLTMAQPYYAENFEALLARCRQHGIAVQTIKALARRPWWGRSQAWETWYEPLTDPGDIDLAVWWVLGRPELFLNSVGDVRLLPLVLDAAERFAGAPDDDAMQQLMARQQAAPLFV